LIAFLSILSLMLFAPTIREVVLRGESAIRELPLLEKQRKNLEQQIGAYEQNLNDTQKSLFALQRRNKFVNAKFQKLEADFQEKQNILANLQSISAGLENSLKQERGQLVTVRAIRKKLEGENLQLTQANRSLTATNKNYIETNSEIGKQNVRLTRANDKLQKSQDELVNQVSQLEKEGRTQEARNLELGRSYAEQKQKNEEAEREAQSRIRQLQELAAAIQANYEQAQLYLKGAADDAITSYVALRERRICLQAGEMLARRTLSSGLAPDEVQGELLTLLSDANAVANVRGARRGTDGLAARLINRKLLPFTMEDSRALDSYVEETQKMGGSVVVVATVVANTLEGEATLITLDIQSVRNTFRRGAEVASTVIDAETPLEQVVNQLVLFLQKDVRDAAVTAGVIPQIDTQTGAKEYGVFGPAELVDLMDKVRKMGGKIKLMAIAERDLTSAEPLRLRFQLGRIKTRS
jgi:hypothetical protein